MSKQLIKDSLGWGFILWLIGYILGMIFFPFIPAAMIGWAIFPIGTAITLWVLFKKINAENIQYFLAVAITWFLVAVVFDYLFIVKLLKSTEYYKIDVYVYYLLILILPLAVGWLKIKKSKSKIS